MNNERLEYTKEDKECLIKNIINLAKSAEKSLEFFKNYFDMESTKALENVKNSGDDGKPVNSDELYKIEKILDSKRNILFISTLINLCNKLPDVLGLNTEKL